VAYFTLAALQALLPEPDLTKALDDDADGIIDAFAAVQGQADGQVDALLSGRYAVPFTGEVPPAASHAAKIFAAELCYKRRGVSDEANPWHEVATSLRQRLTAIGRGEVPLTPAVAPARPSGSIVSEPSPLTTRPGGRLI